MLDTPTLRVAFGLVAICVLVLVYGVTYRSTRSACSTWWCLSLASFILGALLFLLNGTPVQVVANPLGNAVTVLGAGCVWFGARSLRSAALRAWHLALWPAVVLAVSLLDDPVHDVWTGGPFFLTGMATLVGLSSWELAHHLREERKALAARPQSRVAVLSTAIACAAISAFYGLRAVVFVLLGPDHRIFVLGFGGQATTLLTMLLLLVVVTFSMSALSHEQQTSELRDQATRDGMTDALNRVEFLRLAQRSLDTAGTPLGAVVVADLDHFTG